MNTKFSVEKMKNAVDELYKCSDKWNEIVDSGDFSEELLYCGKILRNYANVLKKITDSYEETEKKIKHSAEDI